MILPTRGYNRYKELQVTSLPCGVYSTLALKGLIV